MAIATLSHSLPPLIIFLISLSLFILFFLSLLLKTHKTRRALLLKTHKPRRAPPAEKPLPCQTEPLLTSSTEEQPPKEEDKKKKKKGKKKKKHEPTSSQSGDESKGTRSMVQIGDGEVGRVAGTGSEKGIAGIGYPSFPLTSLPSSLKTRMKSKYDEILTSATQSRDVTAEQATEFIDCLVEAGNELQKRSKSIQNSLKIKDALLSRANKNKNKSSVVRLNDEKDKLEREHRRIKKDVACCVVLQEQLMRSPANKMLLELIAKMENEAPNEQTADISDISFEELLAQEKKDPYWQRNGKMRPFQNNTGK